jgi:hypothetical protein
MVIKEERFKPRIPDRTERKERGRNRIKQAEKKKQKRKEDKQGRKIW